jgi:trehalose-6-phosphatase
MEPDKTADANCLFVCGFAVTIKSFISFDENDLLTKQYTWSVAELKRDVNNTFYIVSCFLVVRQLCNDLAGNFVFMLLTAASHRAFVSNVEGGKWLLILPKTSLWSPPSRTAATTRLIFYVMTLY